MIKVNLEPDNISWPLENCCFCRKPTKYWTECSNLKPGEQLACCEDCAKIVEYNHLPTVKHYLKREDILFELESLK